MSCPPLTNKGGKLYISEEPVDCDLTLSELAVLPYVFVPGVGSIGDTGIEQDIVTYPTMSSGLTAQGKGDATGRNWDIEILDRPSAARDILDVAAAVGNDDSYATRIEWPNGDVEFSIVQVASRTAVKGAASGVRVIRYTMIPSFIPIVTNSLPVASNVVVSGTYFVGDTLTATYDYYSPLGLPESGSKYQWYADGVAIPGADELTYVIDENYEGEMISFGVIPSDGLSEGDESVSAGGGPVFAPESVALFAEMSPEPSHAQKVAIDKLMRNGLLPTWDKRDAFYVLHSYSIQPSLVNWRNPSESAVPVNSPIFYPYSGWQGDGISTEILIPTAFVAFQENDCHLGSAQAIAIAGRNGNPRVGEGVKSSSQTRNMIYPRNGNGTRSIRLSSSGSISPSPVDADVLTVINRTSAATVDTYDDGILTSTDAIASAGAGGGLSLLRRADDYGNMRVNHLSAGASLTADEISAWNDAWRQYLIDMAFVPYGTYTPSVFSDTGSAVDAGDYYVTSSYAHVDFQTSADVVEVRAFNDIYASFASFASIGVYVDGAYYQSILQGSAGDVSVVIPLPPGDKVVSYVNGPQARPSSSAPQKGTFLISVAADREMSQVITPPVNRMVVYGDSISAGDAATPVQSKSWFMQVRTAAGGDSVALEGWGYRSLHEDCSDSAKRAAFIAKIVAYAPSSMWICIGTNDYALNKWTSAAFGGAYAAMLDDLHAAMPALTIYCQTPIIRATEGANSLGDTCPQYRSQIEGVVATRTSFCTLIDGTEILEVADLSDNVHPTTAGHSKYANYVIDYLGI